MTLRLGIIGLSPGNGHPYSWSAIFNGYNPEPMQQCGFPVIPQYLARQQFPQDCIKGARVTHVWAQDPVVARHIADAAFIPHVVNHYTDLIGQVDAVLLARDDAENHVEMALPFLNAGLPVYIDKPLALSLSDARTLLASQQYPGQLFSCSALRYAPELRPAPEHLQQFGTIQYIHATTPKDWARYAIHIIDPMLRLLGDAPPCKPTVLRTQQATLLQAEHPAGVAVQLAALGAASVPIELVIAGTGYCHRYRFHDAFTAFRAALQDFVDGVRQRDTRSSPERLEAAVSWVEAGLQA